MGGAVTGSGALVVRVSGELLGQDGERGRELKDLRLPNCSLRHSLIQLSNLIEREIKDSRESVSSLAA